MKQIQQFLGLSNYYRRFIKNFAQIAYPLYQLLKKSEKFHWDKEHQIAILTFPDFKEEFQISTDASNSGLGAVLSQIIDGNEVVIAFAQKENVLVLNGLFNILDHMSMDIILS